MNPRVLILDDEPQRHDAFTLMLPDAVLVRAYTAGQAITSLASNPAFDIAFLDYDLTRSSELIGVADPGNGLEVANYIASELAPELVPHHLWIHSWNDEGRVKMAKILRTTSHPVTLQKFRYTMRLR